MRSAGYELGSALTFLVVLNLGTAAGPLLVGRIADRVGSKPSVAGSFLLAVLGIAALSRPLPIDLLYAAVALAGPTASLTCRPTSTLRAPIRLVSHGLPALVDTPGASWSAAADELAADDVAQAVRFLLSTSATCFVPELQLRGAGSFRLSRARRSSRARYRG